MSFDPVEIRKLILMGVFAEDYLADHMVLKGGNALALVHKVGHRASLDLDFSVEKELDLERLTEGLAKGLAFTLNPVGLRVCKLKVAEVPVLDGYDKWPWWGGYLATFQVVTAKDFEKYFGDARGLGTNALKIYGEKKTFQIEIGKHEWIEGAEYAELDGVELRVYSPLMCAAEKLRALCQQMDGYEQKGNPKPRPRDFVDIWAIGNHGVELAGEAMGALLSHVFEAKYVPLAWLLELGEQREFHRRDWDRVKLEIDSEPFDFYVDYVLELVTHLHAAGIVETPVV